jgi:hypothetical protein
MVAGSDDQQLCPFFVDKPYLFMGNRMRGAVNPFGQLFLAFLDGAIQSQNDIISDFSPFDEDGAEGCGIDLGTNDFSISFSCLFRLFFLFSWLLLSFLSFSLPGLFCLSFLSFLP